MKKWRKLAEEKAKLNEQTEEIHQKFRMDKINKEFGQLSGEEFFKPITKRLDQNSTITEEEEEEEEEEEDEQEVPDYTMDEFEETYPFGDEFRPDAPTPAPSPTPSPPSPPPPSYQEVVDDDFPPPPPETLMEEKKSTRKEWGMPEPVEKEFRHESTLLQTVNQLITKYGNDPNYKVKSKNPHYLVIQLRTSKK